MLKSYLLTPGPTPVPERVALAMARPILHHRSKAFEQLFAEVREGLAWLYATKQDVITFAASGSGAMEGALVNFLKKGDEILYVDGGKFGERWGKIAKAYGVAAHCIKVEWGKAVTMDQVKQALFAHPKARAFYVQASETSTGVMHPIKEIAAFLQGTELLCVVDGITAVGVWDLPMDAWGIDVLVAGSQKALMLPPGLAFAACSEKAWKANETADLPRFYFDYRKERDSQRKNQTAWTPAVSLLMGLHEVLGWMKAMGKEAIFQRHDRLARAARAAVQAMGLELYAQSPAPSVTTVKGPLGIDTDKLVKHMRDQLGVTMVGGQDEAKGKIFRIAHLGYYDDFDIVVAISAIERGLLALGHKVEFGKGVGAAQVVLAG